MGARNVTREFVESRLGRQYPERWLMQNVNAATEDLFVPYWRCAFCDTRVEARRERCGECGAARPGRT